MTIKYHMIPWRAALDAGAVNIMPGYAGSSYLDPGGPGAGNSKPILDYLRNNLGYTGLITTDWLPSGAWISAANAYRTSWAAPTPARPDSRSRVSCPACRSPGSTTPSPGSCG